MGVSRLPSASKNATRTPSIKMGICAFSATAAVKNSSIVRRMTLPLRIQADIDFLIRFSRPSVSKMGVLSSFRRQPAETLPFMPEEVISSPFFSVSRQRIPRTIHPGRRTSRLPALSAAAARLQTRPCRSAQAPRRPF